MSPTTIKLDSEDLAEICRAIQRAGDQSHIDIGFHEKTPGMTELCDAIIRASPDYSSLRKELSAINNSLDNLAFVASGLSDIASAIDNLADAIRGRENGKGDAR